MRPAQEAKKGRHWKRGEKYFLENKFREAVIEYKNVLQIDPNNAGAHHK
jgi:Tfp pilus assembly protein PilF